MRGRVGFEPITSDRLLLVEGPVDDRFLTALLRANKRSSVQVVSFSGLGKLPATLLALPVVDGFSGLKWLGIVVDADASAMQRFRKVAAWIVAANPPRQRRGYGVPNRSWQAASGEAGVPATVFVLPGSDTAGDLETWLLSAVDFREQARCAEAFVDCLGSGAPVPRSKVVMAAYLAAHDPEKLNIGDAIQSAGVLPLVHEIYRPFLDLIPRDDEQL